MKIEAIPSTMPIDREIWKNQLNISNFVNTYYQYRDVQICKNVKSILVIGPGQGLDTEVLKWKGYHVTTFDIDKTFSPDVIGSVHDLNVFSNKQFDAVIASHVLEHLPITYLDDALREISRVGKYSLIYLPVHGRHMQLRFIPGVKGIDISLIFDLFNYFIKPDGKEPLYCDGMHYWEIGMRGFRIKDVISRLEPFFEIVTHYRNRDWNPSYNFVLKGKGNL